MPATAHMRKGLPGGWVKINELKDESIAPEQNIEH
jgi:hypothetical protein